VFVHHGGHFTAMLRRNGEIYHVDSLPLTSGEGRYVYAVTPARFVEFATLYRQGVRAHGQGVAGGLFSIYYVGSEVLAISG
jgi:hypothetical protein